MATIKDVAKEAGLAVGTVSRIMNNRGYISESARKKVEDAMEKLHYQPNEMARSLQKKATSTIGVIVPHIEHPYFSRLIAELESQAYLNHKKIYLLNSYGAREKEKEFLELCKRNQVAGIVLCNGDVDIDSLKDLNVPIVNIERTQRSGCPSIECDNYTGGLLAARHLIERGCRSLIHINGKTRAGMPADTRGRGFLDACAQSGVNGRIISVALNDYQLPDARQTLHTILTGNPATDGIFASNDIIAAQIIQVCHQRHWSVPRDLRIVGFDDINLAEWTYPPLTTIRQPYTEIAREALKLLDLQHDKKAFNERTILPVELIVRGTT